MFRKTPPLWCEMRDGWVAFYQRRKLLVLPPAVTAGDEGWPAPERVVAALADAGIQVAPALVLLPRTQAFIGGGWRPMKKRRELLASAALEAQGAASAAPGGAAIAVAAASYRKSGRPVGTHPGRVAWCVFPRPLLDEVATWLERCGSGLSQVRVSAWASASYPVPGEEAADTAHALLSVYPSGSWDLVWLSGRERGLPYSVPGGPGTLLPDPAELAQAVALLALRHLAAVDITTLPDIDADIALTSHTLQLILHVAAPPEAGPAIACAVNAATELLAADGIGLACEMAEAPAASGWPLPALQAGATRPAVPQPVIQWDEGAGRWRDYMERYKPAAVAAAGALALTGITCGLVLYGKGVADELASLRAAESHFQTDARTLAGMRAEAAYSENDIAEFTRFVNEQTLPITILHELDDILGSDTILRALEVNGTRIQATVLTSSAARLMQRLDAAALLSEVSMTGEISTQQVDGRTMELMQFSASYRSGEAR